ncbi:MAG: hypothetical protein U0894_10570 [Pirellulales bacterium]
MARIIVLDTIAKEGLELLDAAAPGITYEVKTGLKGDALKAALAEFDGAICRSGVTITGASLEGNRRMKAIVALAWERTTSTRMLPLAKVSW